MICSKCNKDVPELAFCGNCGKPLFKICPTCGRLEVSEELSLRNEEKKKQIVEAKEMLDGLASEMKNKERRRERAEKVLVYITCAIFLVAWTFFLLPYPDSILIKIAVFMLSTLFLAGVVAFLILDAKRKYQKKIARKFKELYPEQANLLLNLSYSERDVLGISWLNIG